MLPVSGVVVGGTTMSWGELPAPGSGGLVDADLRQRYAPRVEDVVAALAGQLHELKLLVVGGGLDEVHRALGDDQMLGSVRVGRNVAPLANETLPLLVGDLLVGLRL